VLATGVALLAFAGGAVAQTTRPAEPPKAPSGQPPSTDQRSPLGTGAETQPKRSIMGTVKKVASDGLVIEEQKTDGGKGREWAFAIEPNTRTRGAKAGDPIKAADLKVGDRVVVAYDDRAGKVVAQTITRLDATQQR
jgi:hypothetical protein